MKLQLVFVLKKNDNFERLGKLNVILFHLYVPYCTSAPLAREFHIYCLLVNKIYAVILHRTLTNQNKAFTGMEEQTVM